MPILHRSKGHSIIWLILRIYGKFSPQIIEKCGLLKLILNAKNRKKKINIALSSITISKTSDLQKDDTRHNAVLGL